MRAVVNEFIYKQTLSALYNLSPSWIHDLGDADAIIKHPHELRRYAYLYYRPRVEQMIVGRADAYRQMVGMRLRRLDDERAGQLDANLTRLELLTVEPIRPFPSMSGLRRMTKDMYRHIKRRFSDNPYRKIDPVEPEPEELFHTALYRLTTYVGVLNEFMNQPGAGLAFLNLRAKAETVATTILVEMLESKNVSSEDQEA